MLPQKSLKKGLIICFIEDLKEHITKEVILTAHTPVELDSFNNHAVTVKLPDGSKRSFRLIPKRMYISGKLGELLYGK